jgi:hypothetical protein
VLTRREQLQKNGGADGVVVDISVDLVHRLAYSDLGCQMYDCIYVLQRSAQLYWAPNIAKNQFDAIQRYPVRQQTAKVTLRTGMDLWLEIIEDSYVVARFVKFLAEK